MAGAAACALVAVTACSSNKAADGASGAASWVYLAPACPQTQPMAGADCPASVSCHYCKTGDTTAPKYECALDVNGQSGELKWRPPFNSSCDNVHCHDMIEGGPCNKDGLECSVPDGKCPPRPALCESGKWHLLTVDCGPSGSGGGGGGGSTSSSSAGGSGGA